MKKWKSATVWLVLMALLWGCTAHTVPETTQPPEKETSAPVTQPVIAATETTKPKNGLLVVIDAGHQAVANANLEPVGPGATQMKAMVSSGTIGVSTGIREYELNLAVSEMLRAILIKRGYTVEMIRTSHDVDISNAQRAQTANDLGADAFIRIHANSSTDSQVEGILTICQTPDNPYNGQLYAQSRRLSQCVLDEMVAATGAEKRYVWETDTMTGINWCQVPVTIVEMGYMSNENEDILLSTEEYRWMLARGIADGIDQYFEK